MATESWRLHGRALRDYFDGDRDAVIISYSDLFPTGREPVALFFREPAEYYPFERAALELCRGGVLDVGAGTGVHALELQRRGFRVTAIDRVPQAVRIMRERGVHDARRADIFEFQTDERFDTVLMLMNGIGIVESLDGLERFLLRAPRLLAPGGQIVADSTDVRSLAHGPDEGADGPLRPDGRYVGEVQFQLEYRGEKGAPFPQLCVDPDTLAAVAARMGWSHEIVFEDDDGGFVTRLMPLSPT